MNWRGTLGLFVASFVALNALFNWGSSISHILIVAVVSAVIAVAAGFLPEFGPDKDIQAALRLIVLGVGLVFILWGQPGLLAPFGYHIGGVLFGAGAALLIGLFFGWRQVNYAKLGVTLLACTVLYAVLAGYPATIAAGLIAVGLIGLVWLIPNLGGISTPLGA